MAPILYYNELSPPVRAVLLTAKAIGLNLELREVSIITLHTKDKFFALNPQQTVPTLNDDGFILWESHAITAYLVGKYAKNDSLYPKDLQKRAVVDQRLHFESGMIIARIRDILGPVLFRGKKEIAKENEKGIIQSYGFVESFLEKSEWFAGSQLTIADFSAVSSISSIAPVIPFDANKYPKLSAWLNKMKSLPYYEVNELGAGKISALVNQHLRRAA